MYYMSLLALGFITSVAQSVIVYLLFYKVDQNLALLVVLSQLVSIVLGKLVTIEQKAIFLNAIEERQEKDDNHE